MHKFIHSFSAKSAVAAMAMLLFLANASLASADTAFSRDLTIGSSGSDVTALQAMLMAKGFNVPAGATGYFGNQTKAAVASYQAANGITPASGFFGPLTRAQVNASANTGTGTGTGTNPGSGTSTDFGSAVLKGGEADLRNFDFKGEASDGKEGQQDVKAATAKFDVKNGDIRIERIDLLTSATNNSLNTQPWKYFDSVSVISDGTVIATESVDNKNDWSEVSKGHYRLTLSGLKEIVRKNDTAELTFSFDIADTIDSANLDQEFALSIDDRGIRATDAAGIQEYTGDKNDVVTFGFGSEENGDLTIQGSQQDPLASILVANARKESSSYPVFAFDLKNSDDADSLLTDLTFNVTDLNAGVNANSVLRKASITAGGTTYKGTVNASTIVFKNLKIKVKGDSKQTITLATTLSSNATSTPVRFSVSNAGIEAEGVKSGDNAQVSGSRTSALHAIAFTGISVAPASTNTALTYNDRTTASSYGTYTLKFKVTALKDDLYIAATSGDTGTVGITYSVTENPFTGENMSALTSTAKKDNGFYRINEGDTETFTLTVTLNPESANWYGVKLDSIRFNTAADLTDSSSYAVDSTKSTYTTDSLYIPE